MNTIVGVRCGETVRQTEVMYSFTYEVDNRADGCGVVHL